MKTQTAASVGVGLGRGGRMSRQRKRDAVVRLLRGEDLEILSRALGVTAATLTGWRGTFVAGGGATPAAAAPPGVAAGEASLATRPTDGEALETERLKAKLGEMLLERELLDAKIAALEANRPWPAGGRGDEPDRLAVKRQALRSGPRVPGLARVSGHHLPPSFLLSARTAPASWPGWADAGPGAGRRDPRGPDRQPVSRRGAPEGLGPAARRGPAHGHASRVAAHARERAAGAI